jgi:8-oxo-dGTP diphosphatase
VPAKQTCVCLITRGAKATGSADPTGEPELLLGLKKRGFGEGRVVAPGGRLEPGETAEQACVREVAEEVGLALEQADLDPAGGVLFRFAARPDWDLYVALFRTDRFKGEPSESDELSPAWYPLADLPWDGMWPDARHWLPRVLAGEVIEAEITLGVDGETVTEAMFHVEHDA